MRILISIIAIVGLVACQNTGMSTTQKGALTAGTLGAGLGAIVGSQSGKAGVGTAIGAAAGLLAGGMLGGSVEKQEQQAAMQQEHLDRQEQTLTENRDLIAQLRARGADVRTTARGVVVNLPDVLFAFDKAILTSDAVRKTKDISDVIKAASDRKIFVEGHTDSVGTLSYNRKLSEDRAWAVADSLAKDGVAKRKIFVKGFGENDPIASNSTEYGRRRNRRVEVIIANR